MHEYIDDEAIIIDLGKGCYYTTNTSATFIWLLIGSRPSWGAIIETVAKACNESPENIIEAINSFLQDLLAHQLINTTDANETLPAESNSLPSLTHFITPSLKIYDDMKELLLIDPIHEVDNNGWPQREKATA